MRDGCMRITHMCVSLMHAYDAHVSLMHAYYAHVRIIKYVLYVYIHIYTSYIKPSELKLDPIAMPTSSSCAHACIPAYMHTCIHACMRTYIHACIQTYIHTTNMHAAGMHEKNVGH